ncbi:MAG: aromatic ring-hydroxylating dioxygenase subunit alpha [Novosphingobium sp.]|uniref:aromatic ring-hydroxylating dioxygenase subunit alpha n=1 Tax=Novosphingobium sp. TaxID=1874826 RepID=UPI0032BA7B6C
MYLRGAWYVAAWADELADQPLARTILGEAVVLFRTEQGSLAALENSCPHRRLPLSRGCVVGSALRCGYHGMVFDTAGQCVEIPGQAVIPATARVRAFPVAERWNLIWIWMGDPDRADPAAIIDIPHYDAAGWATNRGPAMDVACHYQWMTDNLLDPSHVSYVHASSLGSADTIGVPVKTEVGDGRVIVSRWIRDHDLAPFFAKRVGFAGKADRLQHYEVRMPAHAVIKDVIAPAGTGAPEGQLDASVFLIDSYNFVTPVDADNCRYFWFQVRNYAADDAAESAALTEDFIAAFNEDLVVLADVHAGMKTHGSKLDLATDLGSNQARRMLARMIKAEAAAN